MTDMQLRKGFMRFHRLGPIKFHKQKGVPHAPERWGIWAFPYPYFDWSFVGQQYYKHLPKDAAIDWDKQEAWLKRNRHKVARLSSFWYSGDVYSHFLPSGEVGVDSRWYYEDEVDWNLTDVTNLARLLRQAGVDRREVAGEYKGFKPSNTFSEVFIPRGRGVIRHNVP